MKRKEYLEELRNLRTVAENLKVDNNSILVDKNGEVEKNEGNIIRMKFCILYVLAYKKFLESIDNKGTFEVNDGFVERVLSDYNIYRSIINNSIVEYNMYNQIGTGNISYFPYQVLANSLFNEKNIPTVTSYLKSEFKKDLDITEKQGKSL